MAISIASKGTPEEVRGLVKRIDGMVKHELNKIAEGIDSLIPVWSPARRELHYGNRLCKKFRQPAPKQTRILDAFAEEGWPPKIYNPLTPEPNRVTRQQLADAVRGLNENPCIQFELDGTGEGILWRPR
jgi:hypothetical protein